MFLRQFGWNNYFATQPCRGIPGRVTAANREHFLLWTEEGEKEATVSGHLRHTSALWPVTGDWVDLRPNSPVIDAVFERKTKLSRKHPGKEMREQVLAANIDVLLIVSGLDYDYNPRRIERYLVLASDSGARPVVLLNKADLVPELSLDLEQTLEQTRALVSCVPVLTLSAISGEGLDALPFLLQPGETAALIGSSGAGKSTILNHLLGKEQQRTTPVRTADHRGRHTTTGRQIFAMPSGWLLMDLPGLRELQLWTDPEQVEQAFADIESLAQSCRFRNCSHTSEPGCAVRNDASLDGARLANFQKLQREQAYWERKSNPEKARKERNRWKTLERSVRKHPKRENS